jgi:DNA-binding SARP family transcriptional activator
LHALSAREPLGPQQPTVEASAAQLQIRCLGSFEVVASSVPVKRWRRRAAATILKYLVTRRRPVHRDVLLELLWPELPSDAGLNALRVAVHALRRALAPGGAAGTVEPLITMGSAYLLNPAAGVWIDADAFTGHFESGLRFERQARTADAMREYAAAEALYRDDFLVEDLYEEWTALRREELRDQYLMVLTKLAQQSIAVSDPEGCIRRCHKLLSKEPCTEEAYRGLMRAYAMLGQYGRAAHWYDVCARTMRRELDVDPSPETEQLQREHARRGAGRTTSLGVA